MHKILRIAQKQSKLNAKQAQKPLTQHYHSQLPHKIREEQKLRQPACIENLRDMRIKMTNIENPNRAQILRARDAWIEDEKRNTRNQQFVVKDSGSDVLATKMMQGSTSF